MDWDTEDHNATIDVDRIRKDLLANGDVLLVNMGESLTDEEIEALALAIRD